ncbi:hypothetical protein GCM10028777_00010 [Angustibacter speluncae]
MRTREPRVVVVLDMGGAFRMSGHVTSPGPGPAREGAGWPGSVPHTSTVDGAAREDRHSGSYPAETGPGTYGCGSAPDFDRLPLRVAWWCSGHPSPVRRGATTTRCVSTITGTGVDPAITGEPPEERAARARVAPVEPDGTGPSPHRRTSGRRVPTRGGDGKRGGTAARPEGTGSSSHPGAPGPTGRGT